MNSFASGFMFQVIISITLPYLCFTLGESQSSSTSPILRARIQSIFPAQCLFGKLVLLKVTGSPVKPEIRDALSDQVYDLSQRSL